MYCSHCGKKVGETMLFCPFCGEEIIIPEQEEPRGDRPRPDPAPVETPDVTVEDLPAADPPAPQADQAQGDVLTDGDAAAAAAELEDWSHRRRDAIDDWERPEHAEEPFEPLKLDQTEAPQEDWRSEISRKKQAVRREKKPPRMRRGETEPVRLEGAAPKLEHTKTAKPSTGGEKPSRKPANTLVPEKAMNPKDIFMSQKTSAYDDDYDDDYDKGAPEPFAGGFDFDDEEESGFLLRHLRGIVGLALFGILILLFVIFSFSKSGQMTLARVNLAWTTEPYSQLGYQSYQEGRYAQAGKYYERALLMAPNDYSFAQSAAMAYIEAGETEKAAAMLKRCAEINPTRLEPYIYLLRLYPDAAERPWDITQLLQQGYQRTGDVRLNVTG